MARCLTAPTRCGSNKGCIRRNGFGVLERAVWTLEVTRHHIPDLPGFQVGGHERFPGREVVASCQRLDGRDRSVGRVVDQSRHGDGCESGVDIVVGVQRTGYLLYGRFGPSMPEASSRRPHGNILMSGSNSLASTHIPVVFRIQVSFVQQHVIFRSIVISLPTGLHCPAQPP